MGSSHISSTTMGRASGRLKDPYRSFPWEHRCQYSNSTVTAESRCCFTVAIIVATATGTTSVIAGETRIAVNFVEFIAVIQVAIEPRKN